jgi:hypothetical protein
LPFWESFFPKSCQLLSLIFLYSVINYYPHLTPQWHKEVFL